MKALILIISSIAVGLLAYCYNLTKIVYRLNKKAYDKQYARLQDEITNCDVNKANYKRLCLSLKRLADMRYKNREKTSVLITTFLRKFYK